eukprot:jgi/Picre1/35330/NNA_002792.t1
MFQQVDDPLVLLSELQGQYAFALVDGDRKQVFAARDSSGKEHMYFEIDEDGGLTISNERLRVNSPRDWAGGMGGIASWALFVWQACQGSSVCFDASTAYGKGV